MDGRAALRIIEALGLKRAEVARLIGISPTAAQKWTTGGKPHEATATLLLLLKERPELIAVLRRIKGLD